MRVTIVSIYARNESEKRYFRAWLKTHRISHVPIYIGDEGNRILLPAIRTRYNLYEGETAVGHLMAEFEK